MEDTEYGLLQVSLLQSNEMRNFLLYLSLYLHTSDFQFSLQRDFKLLLDSQFTNIIFTTTKNLHSSESRASASNVTNSQFIHKYTSHGKLQIATVIVIIVRTIIKVSKYNCLLLVCINSDLYTANKVAVLQRKRLTLQWCFTLLVNNYDRSYMYSCTVV
jgi:hypothetical protein